MRSARVLSLFAALAILAAACSGAAPQPSGGGGSPSAAPAQKATPGGTITFALEDDPIDFDPLRSRAFIDRNIHYQIYD